jgi:hypothetical protein
MDSASNSTSTEPKPQYGYPSAPYAEAPVPWNDSLQVTGEKIVELLKQAQTSLQEADGMARRAYGRRLAEWFTHTDRMPDNERVLIAGYFSAYYNIVGMIAQIKAEMAKK